MPAELLRFGVSPWELVLRGTLVWWFLFGLFRFVLRRDAGSMGIADILLVVLIADASQNAMSGGYGTVAEGFVLMGTLIAWNAAMDWAGWRFSLMRRFFAPAPVVLVRRGHLVARNLRREYITVPELMAQLRQHGVEKLAEVKIARMEPDGNITVIRAEGPPQAAAGAAHRAPWR